MSQHTCNTLLKGSLSVSPQKQNHLFRLSLSAYLVKQVKLMAYGLETGIHQIKANHKENILKNLDMCG